MNEETALRNETRNAILASKQEEFQKHEQEQQKQEIQALLAEELTKLTNDSHASFAQRTIGRKTLALLKSDKPVDCDFSLYTLAYYRLGVGADVTMTKSEYDRALRFAELRKTFHEAYRIHAA